MRMSSRVVICLSLLNMYGKTFSLLLLRQFPVKTFISVDEKNLQLNYLPNYLKGVNCNSNEFFVKNQKKNGLSM